MEAVSMIIKTEKTGEKMIVQVAGRLDTTTAPEFEQKVKENIDGVTELEIDFSDLEYISSAGLRVLLSAQKIMNEQGSMSITGANDTVKEIFGITGFADILDIR